MKTLLSAITVTLFAAGAFAQAPAPATAPAAKPVDQKPMIAPAKPGPHPGADCNAKAVGSDGKPLAGAAKGAFMKKCMADSRPGPAGKPEGKPDVAPAKPGPHPGADCNAKAVGSDGKPLAGAAKGAFMKKCMADSKPAPADKPEIKPMPGKPMPGPNGKQPSPAQQAQQDKMKACAAQGKGMKGPEHQKFMKECLSKK